MKDAWPVMGLLLIVVFIMIAQHRTALQVLFRWLPLPLWCYALPMVAVSVGWMPAHHPTYRTLTDQLLPIALVLLLLGVDLHAVTQAGLSALLAAGIGALGIIIGAPIGVALLSASLPPEAWKGAATLAATWTGGTMNLLSLRTILGTPEAVFAPLIVVDAMVAYGWMALLVALSAAQRPIDRWLRVPQTSITSPRPQAASKKPQSQRAWLMRCLLIAMALAIGAQESARYLPLSTFISTTAGWTILLATSSALGLSLIPAIRRIGAAGEPLGYACLYLVLAATGAQASLSALWSAPVWILLGLCIVVVHAGCLVLAGRLWRIPLGLLATASQANIGGVVSAPMVGAVYDQALVPVGLLLAIAGNALGTYFGLFSAQLCRWFLHLTV